MVSPRAPDERADEQQRHQPHRYPRRHDDLLPPLSTRSSGEGIQTLRVRGCVLYTTWAMPPLPVGKLPAQLLQRLFAKYVAADPRVVVGPQVGEDAAVLDMGDRYLVATTDPITFATDEMGWYALHVNANDLAVRGASPRWFMATVLLPEGKSQEAQVEQLFAELAEACATVGVSLVGGHTEVTGGLPRPIVVGAMLGEVDKDKLVTTGGAQVGDVVLLTKGVPLEGAAIIARERGDEALRRGVAADVVERARGAAGVDCSAIGRVTAASDGVALVSGCHARPMPTFPQDEITRIFGGS